jgi:hypothetical protein
MWPLTRAPQLYNIETGLTKLLELLAADNASDNDEAVSLQVGEMA